MTETATQHKNNVEWGQAKGFSKYLISTDGQVYSLKRDRLLPQGYTQRGYKQVDVCNDQGIKKHMRVHRLVYMAHIGVIPEGMQINHKDENKVNNCIDNLELIDDTGKPYYVNEYTESYTVPTQYKVFFTLSLFCGFR